MIQPTLTFRLHIKEIQIFIKVKAFIQSRSKCVNQVHLPSLWHDGIIFKVHAKESARQETGIRLVFLRLADYTYFLATVMTWGTDNPAMQGSLCICPRMTLGFKEVQILCWECTVLLDTCSQGLVSLLLTVQSRLKETEAALPWFLHDSFL